MNNKNTFGVAILFCLGVSVISSCAPFHTSTVVVTKKKPTLTLSQEQTWNLMIGKWYGSQPTNEGGMKQEIMERSSQGTYQIIFRVYDKVGKFEEQIQVGNWGVSGPVYFTIFRGHVDGSQIAPSNPADPYNYDAYRIIRLNSDMFEYESFSTGNKYTLRKVSDEFTFPDQVGQAIK